MDKKLTVSAAETSKFDRVFPRAWSVISMKVYFIQQHLHALGALGTPLKLIKSDRLMSFYEQEP